MALLKRAGLESRILRTENVQLETDRNEKKINPLEK